MPSIARPKRTLAAVNSGFLARHLEVQGIGFERSWAFKPRLNPALRARLRSAAPMPMERTMLVYGRPGIERNAFPLLVAGLQQWVAQHEDSTRWRVLSTGRPHAEEDLGRGLRLRSLSQLPLDAYAQSLASSAVSVSLMVSPRPSYRPLEMAAFGCRVMTNRFATNDLSTPNDRIVINERLDRPALAAADVLVGTAPKRIGRFLDRDDPFVFAGELAAAPR